MTIAQLYNKLTKNEVSRSYFLSEARKSVPQWATQLMSFDDTIRQLKSKGVIKESIGDGPDPDFWDEEKTKTPDINTFINRIENGLGYITDDQVFNEFPDDMPQAEQAKILYALAEKGLLYHEGSVDTTDLDAMPSEEDKISPEEVDQLLNNIDGKDSFLNTIQYPHNLNEGKKDDGTVAKFADKDRVNYYEYRAGLRIEVEKGKQFDAAEKLVLKNLARDPIYYTNQKAGIKKKKLRSDVSQEVTKNNHTDKKNAVKTVGEKTPNSASKAKVEPLKHIKVKELTFKALRAKGIKGVMEMPGKEKKVKLKEMLENQAGHDSWKSGQPTLATIHGGVKVGEGDTVYYAGFPATISSIFRLQPDSESKTQIRATKEDGETVTDYALKFKPSSPHFDDNGDSIQENSGNNKKESIQNLLSQVKSEGGRDFSMVQYDLEEYGLRQDEIHKVMYKLAEKQLLLDESGDKMSTQDIDMVLDNYDSKPGEAVPSTYSVAASDITKNANLNEETDPQDNFIKLENDEYEEFAKNPVIRKWLDTGKAKLSQRYFFYSDEIMDQVKAFITKEDGSEGDHVSAASLGEDCNCGFKQGESFPMNESFGKFKKGEIVTISEIKIGNNDIALIVENKKGAKDTFYLDKNDTIK